MNRIYKVIWNEALNCFTAVGEYAKGCGKSSKSSVSSNATINTTATLSSIKTLRLSAIGIGLLAAGFGMQANAVGTYFAGDNPAPKIDTNPLLHQTLTVKGGETVAGDSSTKNISVTANKWDKSLTIKLDETVDLGADGSLKTGDTLVDNSGIKITASDPLNNVVLNSNGLDNGNNKITNVANGNVTAGSNDAVNGSQLYRLVNIVNDNKTKYYSVDSEAIGNANNDGATGYNAMAMGGNAKATGSQAIAIGSSEFGQQTLASGEQSIAIGANVVSRGGSSIAIGGDDLNLASIYNIDGSITSTDLNSGTVNTAFNEYAGRDLLDASDPYAGNTESGGAASIAIGVKASTAGHLATAMGTHANAAATASSAFGVAASATEKGSVALGAGSVANVAGGAVGYVPTGTDMAATTAILDTQSGVNFGAVSVGTGKAGGNRQIVNVAAGSQDSDAVNVSQLKAVTDIANRGWDISAQGNSTTKSTVEPGESVDLNSKNSNIVVSKKANSNDVSFELSDNLDLGDNGSVSTGNILGGTNVNRLGIVTGGLLMGGVTTVSGVGVTVTGTNPLSNATLTSDGLSMIGGPSITKSGGVNAGNKRVINVDDGIQAKDAVNVSQLNSSSAAAKTEVAAGTNVAGVAKSTGGNGQDIYTVNADGASVSKGSDAVTVTAGAKDAVTNMTDYAVDLSDASKASLVKADSAMQTIITQIDGEDVKTLDKANNTANFLSGKNIILTDEDGDIKVSTLDEVEFTKVTTGDTLLNTDGVTIAGGFNQTVTLSNSGLNNGGNRIINVDDGQGDTDAVNVRQLNSSSAAAKTEVAAGTNVAGVTKSTGGNGQDIYTVNADGTTVSKGSDAVTVTAGDKDAVTNMTDYAVDLSEASKASLVKADSAIQTVVAQIDGNAVKTLNQTDNTANFITGDNIVLTAENDGIKIATAENVIFTSVTTGNTLLNTGGVSFLGGSTVSLSSNGLNNGNNQITNVASGVGDDFNAANIGDVNRASAAAKTEVAAGTNVAGVVKSTSGNGQNIYTVNADGATVSKGSDAVTVTAGAKDAVTNMTDYAIDLSDASKSSLVKADSAMQTVVAQIDGNAVKTLNQTDNTANFITGDNIVLTADNDGIKIATAENVTFTSVSFADSTVRLSSDGLNNGGNRIINVDDGQGDTDAVNVRQLNATNSTVDLGLNFTGDDTTAIVNRKLGQTLTIQGGATELTENNIGVIADEDGTLNVRLAEDVVLGTNGSVRMENTVLNNAGITITDGPKQTVTLSNEGLDNGNNRIIKVGEGIAPSDAVNFAQLTTTNNEIAKGIRIGDGNSANDQQFALGDTINVTGDRNLTTVASATGVQVKLNNQLDLGDDGSIQIGNSIMSNAGFTFVDNTSGRMLSQVSQVSLTSRGLDNGGNTITNIGAGTLDNDAVNVGQLKEVAIALDQGWGITAQGDIATMVKQGDALDLNSKDGNIIVSRTSVNSAAPIDANARTQAAAIPVGVNDISFDLNPDLSLNSVTTGDTTINSDGLTIVGGPSITKSGINAAGNKVTNIQNGEVTVDSQDAINGSQLYAQGSGINSIIGGATVYNAANGTFTNSDIGGTGEGSIDGAIASIRQGTIEINETVQINTTAISTNTTNIATNTTNIATNTTNIATNTSNIATNTTNIQSNTDKLTAGLNFGADSGADINKPVGDGSVLSFTGGNNITTTAEGSSIKFDLNGNINVDSVTTGTTVINSNGISMQGGPSMTAQGINAGSQRITGVADGIEATDAVNYSQLSALDSRLNSNMSDLGYKINEVEDDANAGISAAMAMSALPQAYISGKSLIGGGVSTYNGESAVAVGFSKLSNDGRWVIKVNGTADTQGNVGGAVGAGFHFD